MSGYTPAQRAALRARGLERACRACGRPVRQDSWFCDIVCIDAWQRHRERKG